MKIETKKIHNGVVRVTTSDERWYIYDDVPYTSATWICSYVPSKELMIWMAKKGYDEAERIKIEAGSKGSRVHKGCEILACGGAVDHNLVLPDSEGVNAEITADEYWAIMTFKDFAETENVIFKKTEHTVRSKELLAAGTLDIDAEINGQNWIIDIKTSSEIHLSHKAQLSFYRHSDEYCNQDYRMGILQVGYKKNKKGWKFTEVEDNYEAFLAARHFWYLENADKKPLQRDFPLTLKIEKQTERK